MEQEFSISKDVWENPSLVLNQKVIPIVAGIQDLISSSKDIELKISNKDNLSLYSFPNPAINPNVKILELQPVFIISLIIHSLKTLDSSVISYEYHVAAQRVRRLKLELLPEHNKSAALFARCKQAIEAAAMFISSQGKSELVVLKQWQLALDV